MRQSDRMNKRSLLLFTRAGIAAAISLCLLAGCLPGAKAPLLVDQYTLEYAPPVKSTAAPYNSSIRVDRFAVAQVYNASSMVYRPNPYRLATYGDSRWRVNPADMVTDYIVRDLRATGAFLGVFSYRDIETARFTIEGGVEEFLEVDEGSTGKAVLSLNIILIDTTETEITKRIIFQKTYRATEPLKEQSSAAFAQGMSAAVKSLSEQALKDISESVRRLGVK
jgi:ABC-type uncharacterized transport system auxiliary subunit